MSISFTGTLTEKDFHRFQQIAMPAFSRWFFKLSPWFGWFLLGFTLIFIFTGFYQIDSLFFSAILCFYFLWLPKQRERQIKQAWESNKALRGEISGVIDREAIVWNTAYLNAAAYLNMRCPWETLLQYREQADMLVIYTAINQAIILPRNFFQSEEDWQQLRQLVAEMLPKNKPNKKSQIRSR